MLRGRELKGLPVFKGNHSVEIGRVNDWLIDDLSGNIKALVVLGNGIWQRSFLALPENISSITKKGVIIREQKKLCPLPKHTETFYQMGWLGSKVLAQNGQDRGTVSDIVIDNMPDQITDQKNIASKMIRVKGLEISNGLMEDLATGRNYLPFSSVMYEYRDGSFIESDVNS